MRTKIIMDQDSRETHKTKTCKDSTERNLSGCSKTCQTISAMAVNLPGFEEVKVQGQKKQ